MFAASPCSHERIRIADMLTKHAIPDWVGDSLARAKTVADIRQSLRLTAELRVNSAGRGEGPMNGKLPLSQTLWSMPPREHRD
jgi:hypothetical protein